MAKQMLVMSEDLFNCAVSSCVKSLACREFLDT